MEKGIPKRTDEAIKAFVESITNNQKSKTAYVYWSSNDRDEVQVLIGKDLRVYPSLELLAESAVQEGWFENIDALSEQLPEGAEKFDDDDFDCLNELIDQEGGVSSDMEAFSLLVAAKGACEVGDYESAIASALAAVELMEQLKEQ
jgi:hypothetical protein